VVSYYINERDAGRRRIIAISLIVAFFVILVLDFTLVKAQPITKKVFSTGEFPVLRDSKVPPVTAAIDATFESIGSLSANNEMTITVQVYVNDTNFLNHYRSLGLYLNNGAESIGIPLQKVGDSYVGSIKTTWKSGGDLFYWFVPRDSGNPVPAGKDTTPPAFTIGGDGETYSWKYGLETTRLTWVVIAFSVILIQPVLDAVFRLRSS